jgi:hypothetical protein
VLVTAFTVYVAMGHFFVRCITYRFNGYVERQSFAR